MRRRGESKKSNDVPPSAKTGSRRASRRNKSPVTEDDKSDDNIKEQPTEKIAKREKVDEIAGVSVSGRRGHGDQISSSVAEEADRTSSEERMNNKRRRSSRHLTPIKEVASPMKRTRNNRLANFDVKAKTVLAEVHENANCNAPTNTTTTKITTTSNSNERIDKLSGDDTEFENIESVKSTDVLNENLCSELDKCNQEFVVPISKCIENTDSIGDNLKQETSEENQENDNEIQSKQVIESIEDISSADINTNKAAHVDEKHEENEGVSHEIQPHAQDETPQSSSRERSFEMEEKPQTSKPPTDCNEPEEGEVSDQSDKLPVVIEENANSIEDVTTNTDTVLSCTNEQRNSNVTSTDQNGELVAQSMTGEEAKPTSQEVKHNTDSELNETFKSTKTTVETTRTRKRRWITRKPTDTKDSVLSISTDSLKTLIAEVHPVPLSDVQLESSSEVEALGNYEEEQGEKSPTEIPQQQPWNASERPEKSAYKPKEEVNDKASAVITAVSIVPNQTQRSPSPAHNQTSNVLYITNLVRPFTVLQLKGLLARTGKITEDGFWIDRIKSKCYVEYETEDEAVETRHALHGVRWPVSNPKCLNVDFGLKSDMQKAIDSTKKDSLKFGQEAVKDNILISSGRERSEQGNKVSWPMREWDMGKKHNLEHEKLSKDAEKRRDRSFERENSRLPEKERSEHRIRDDDRDDDRERRRRERSMRSSSLSPSDKQKKKTNDPPLRLLDDLFRKTKATPCIYWLPLTPEQIAEKEAFHQKRLEEQKLRLKQRELEREKERNRNSEKGRNERSHRRNRSNERRRSRSHGRRRY